VRPLSQEDVTGLQWKDLEEREASNQLHVEWTSSMCMLVVPLLCAGPPLLDALLLVALSRRSLALSLSRLRVPSGARSQVPGGQATDADDRGGNRDEESYACARSPDGAEAGRAL
jgi:hypothetical protein